MRRLIVALAAIGSACSTPLSAPSAGPPTPPELFVPAAAAAGAPATGSPFSGSCTTTPTAIGRVQDVQLNEISGVVESRKNPEVLFVHNDSGDSPRFFAINRRGAILAELQLETVPLLIDAEDITIGRGPGDASFIYLGDTGNNFASFGQGIPRRKAVLYRIPEPDIPSSARNLKLPLREAFPIVLTFPRGARDVEAFFIDPVSGDLFVISKQPDGHSQVLTASAAQLAGGGGELVFLGELRFGAEPLPGSTMPTSASISQDGQAILVRTYSSVFLFSRRTGESPMSALVRAPLSYPSPTEQQGEAIAFVDGATAFITISEGIKPAVNCGSLSTPPKP
jgi:hypothetical protein